MNCYFCEVNPATSTKFGKPACESCNFDEYLTIENPITARKRTDEQNAERQKMMKMAFEHAFNECWYCEKNIGTSKKHGELICDSCINKLFRVILDPSKQSKMTEKELAFQLRVFICMSEVGRKAKEGL